MKTLIYRLFTIILLSTTSIASINAQNINAFKGKVANGYNFWLAEPSAKAPSVIDSVPPENDGKPLVVFLHGASLCGNNLDKVLRYGTIDAIKRGLGLDAYVIAPQTQGAWSPKRVMNIVDYVIDKYPDIDTTRVYVVGMSLGGYGTIDVANAYPDRVAAAIAICGGGTGNDFSALNSLPMWIVHGTADRAVPISQSDKVVASMRKHNPDTPRLVYDRVAGMNHSQPARMLYMPEVYNWLFSHSTTDDDRSVEPAFKINSATMRNAYTNLKGSNVTAINRYPKPDDKETAMPAIDKPAFLKDNSKDEAKNEKEIYEPAPRGGSLPGFEPIPLIIIPQD